MLYELSTYIKNIAVFLIFSTFVEIIMPNGKYKEYIRFILGIILIVIMIKPINNLISSIDKNFDISIMKVQSELNKYTASYESDLYAGKQKELIKKEFQSNIKSQIISIIKNYLTVNNIEVLLKEDSFDIEQINIYASENSDENILSAKNSVSDFYNLSIDNIHITIQKN